VQSALNGTSFGGALREAIVGDLATLGANQIGNAQLDTVPHALAHAALGAISAELTGKDALAGAIGALTSALAAAPLDDALGLTGEERKVAVTALAMLAGGMASDALGHDPLTGAYAALNEVTNNYLSHRQILDREYALRACNGKPLCEAKVKLAYALLDGKQDVGLAVGIGAGIGVQSYDGAMAIVTLLEDIPGTVRALQALIDDPAVRSQITQEFVDGYAERLARLDIAYQDGGWDGSVTAGVEAGRLVVDVLGLVAAAKGVAQLGSTLTRSLGRDATELASIGGAVAEERQLTFVIGRIRDLDSLGPGEATLLDRLPYRGDPKSNWNQNASVLREIMRLGRPIRDSSPMDTTGQFLNAERNLLLVRGWTFDQRSGYWMPPNK